MRKRHKAIFPVLCLLLIVVGSVAIYLMRRDSPIEGERAAIQACDQARNAERPPNDPVLENCGRQNK